MSKLCDVMSGTASASVTRHAATRCQRRPDPEYALHATHRKSCCSHWRLHATLPPRFTPRGQLPPKSVASAAPRVPAPPAPGQATGSRGTGGVGYKTRPPRTRVPSPTPVSVSVSVSQRQRQLHVRHVSGAVRERRARKAAPCHHGHEQRLHTASELADDMDAAHVLQPRVD